MWIPFANCFKVLSAQFASRSILHLRSCNSTFDVWMHADKAGLALLDLFLPGQGLVHKPMRVLNKNMIDCSLLFKPSALSHNLAAPPILMMLAGSFSQTWPSFSMRQQVTFPLQRSSGIVSNRAQSLGPPADAPFMRSSDSLRVPLMNLGIDQKTRLFALLGICLGLILGRSSTWRADIQRLTLLLWMLRMESWQIWTWRTSWPCHESGDATVLFSTPLLAAGVQEISSSIWTRCVLRWGRASWFTRRPWTSFMMLTLEMPLLLKRKSTGSLASNSNSW